MGVCPAREPTDLLAAVAAVAAVAGVEAVVEAGAATAPEVAPVAGVEGAPVGESVDDAVSEDCVADAAGDGFVESAAEDSVDDGVLDDGAGDAAGDAFVEPAAKDPVEVGDDDVAADLRPVVLRPEAVLRVVAGFAGAASVGDGFGAEPAEDGFGADSCAGGLGEDPAVVGFAVDSAAGDLAADPFAGPSNGSSGDSGAAFFAARPVAFVVRRRGVFFGGWSAGLEAAGVGGWFSSLTGCSFGLAWGRADGSTSG